MSLRIQLDNIQQHFNKPVWVFLWFGWVLNDVTIAGIMKIVTFENKVVCAKHAVLQHPRINLNVKGVSSMFVQGCGL